MSNEICFSSHVNFLVVRNRQRESAQVADGHASFVPGFGAPPLTPEIPGAGSIIDAILDVKGKI